MHRRRRSIFALLVVATAITAAIVAVPGWGDSSRLTAGGHKLLVVETVFDMTTGDPQRDNSGTGQIVNRAIYQTLLQYGAHNEPVPFLAKSYSHNRNATRYTFHLRSGIVFANGAPITAQDVVWSLRRLKYLNDADTSLVSGIKRVSAPSKRVVVITTFAPNASIPSLVGSPYLGILNSKLMKQHGGTDARNAATADKATPWLQTHSAGSGPYQLKRFSLNSEVVLTKNPHYWGPKPAYHEIDIRDVQPSLERLDVLDGRANLALDLIPPDIAGNEKAAGLKVFHNPGRAVFFLNPTADPKVSPLISKPLFWDAVRYALNTKQLAQLVGKGAIPACGIISTQVPGALPRSACVHQNLARARNDLKRLGNTHPTITIQYPTAFSTDGVDYGVVSQRVASQLSQVGIKVNLEGQAFTTWLSAWRKDQIAVNQTSDSVNFPDPAAYLDLIPGNHQALRFGWKTGADPKLARLQRRALAATSDAKRIPIYRAIQRELNAHSPVIPEFQASQIYLAAKSLRGVKYSFQSFVDLTALHPAK